MEDVEVLKKELVQVQMLMDNMTREREEESERLKSQYKQLQANFTTSEVSSNMLGPCLHCITNIRTVLP